MASPRLLSRIPRSLSRIVVNVALDFVLAAASVSLAGWIAAPLARAVLPPWAMGLGGIALLVAGLPFRLATQHWRFAGLRDLLGVVGASVIGAALFAAGARLAGLALPTPSFPIVHAFTLLALLGIPRIGYRLMQARLRQQGPAGMLGLRALLHPADDRQAVLLIGAGDGADLFIRALQQDRTPPYRIAGLVPLASRHAGRRIHGYPILGGIEGIGAVLDRLRAQHRLPAILVLTEEIGGGALAALLDEADRAGVQVRRAPRPTALHPPATTDARAASLELKPVAIEDLLNRPQLPLDREGMARLIQGRRVLVTGAGGTIGSELARQVAALGPDLLVLIDNGEYALWQIDLELAETHPQVPRPAHADAA